MNVRVVHEGTWTYPGGAERLAREMARALDAKVTVGHSGNPGFWNEFDVKFPFQHLNEGWMRHLPRQVKELYNGIMFRTLEFEEDIVISSGTTAKWWSPRADQRHIHYCHSPPTQVFVDSARGFVDSAIKTEIGKIDKFYADMCDEIVSNSEFTASRVETYYDSDSAIIHPPIDTDRFVYREPSADPHFVMIGRLNEMKRAGVVAEAFQELDAMLVLIGDGPLREECESIENVVVYEYLSDEELRDVVAFSKGGIAFAEKEHCGMTPKEFQSAGKPVLVPDEPNLQNHVNEGFDGVVVEPTVEGVREGVRNILETTWNEGTIQKTAEEWSTERFHEEIMDLVTEKRRG